MNGQYGGRYTNDGGQQGSNVNYMDGLDGLGRDAMGTYGMGGGESLDEIINMNHKEMQRRRSMGNPRANTNVIDGNTRSASGSMMEFGSEANENLTTFDFDPSPIPSAPTPQLLQRRGSHYIGGDLSRRRQQSRESLALNTQMEPSAAGYAMSKSAPYQSPMNYSASPNFIPQAMATSMDFSVPYTSASASGDGTPVNFYTSGYQRDDSQPLVTQNFASPIGMQQNMSLDSRVTGDDPVKNASSTTRMQDMMQGVQGQILNTNSGYLRSADAGNLPNMESPIMQNFGQEYDDSQMGFSNGSGFSSYEVCSS